MSRVVIVGAGVIGLFCARELRAAGHDVVVLDRDAESADRCSTGNAGMIVPSHFIPLASPGTLKLGIGLMLNPSGPFGIALRPNLDLIGWVLKFMGSANATHVHRCGPILRDMNLLSRRMYEEYATQRDFGLVERGLLMLCKKEHTLHEEAELVPEATALGIRARTLTKEELKAVDPTIDMDVLGAVHFEDDCHLSPNRLVELLQADLKAAGVEFHYGVEVTGYAGSGDRLAALHTSIGDVEGDEFVLAAGSWSGELAKNLGLGLPMQGGKGYSFTVEKPKQLPTLCSILTEARIAVTPMGDTLRFAGTMEIVGLNTSINPRRLQGIKNSIPDYFPAYSAEDFATQPVWSGLRPCSPDGMPYIGRFGHLPNLIAATGHAMMGLSLAPSTGRLVAEIVDGRKPSVELGLVRPDRFHR